MKNEDALKLEPSQKVIHRRYGVCIVKKVMKACGEELFGVIIRPDNKNGRALLLRDSGCDVPNMLEDQTRNPSIEKARDEPGEKPLDYLTAWGTPEKGMPQPEHKNHFGQFNEGV